MLPVRVEAHAPHYRRSDMETIEVARSGGVVTITLNRPAKKNAMNTVMWDELSETFREINRSEEDRVVVITGAGGDFCSGADLWAGAAEGTVPRHQLAAIRDVTNVALLLSRLPQPVIAKVRGFAVGAGLNLALMCDLVLASDTAKFSEIFSKRGLSLDFGGSWILPRRVSLHQAKELAFFADIIDAAEADRIGLVNRVVPDAELDALVDEWAQRLRRAAAHRAGQSKRLLNNTMNVTLEEALDDEGAAQTVNFGTKDTPEAIMAWAEAPPGLQGQVTAAGRCGWVAS